MSYAFSSMQPVKTFSVFGERVDVLISKRMSGGSASVLTQTCPPGGGPPPHRHTYEDEIFQIASGEFELFYEGEWRRLLPGEIAMVLRGSVHTFRNCGTAEGTLMITVVPGGFEEYLEEIGAYSPATDMARVIEISERYGITFM